jgi:molybdopterin synthase catalytic subunit
MLRVHEAVQQLQSRSVAAILVFLGMEKNNSNRQKTKRALKNMDKYETEIKHQELAAPI